MTKEILYCSNCNNYTLKTMCKKCGNKTTSILPPKFSVEDKFGEYRRKYKINKNEL